MNTRRNRMYIVMAIVAILFVKNYKSFFRSFYMSEPCQLEAKAKDLTLDGLVLKKYTHQYRTIEIKGRWFNDVFYISNLEDSLLWKSVRVNDSILKKPNSLAFYLTRHGKKIEIETRYNCK
ncbi:hypothetical protein [Mucilaginibacter psychrotolerans]|uniref:Uncharacterized protein n=1 Tax=Mucilaginibacter psychrotolerans TaxID=1524096 RepID=A0A4Y8SBQ3_9SPHI|nr:hypothetical protein [Mucilaginibacter psychrotolerans]TFF36010.1 hypothetical protein E2R66_17485 [Mucilaginibacter psychrotolerans]